MVTRDGQAVLTPPGVTLEPDQTQPQNLRAYLLEHTGVDALLLHDDGLQLGLDRDAYCIRMEALSALPGTLEATYQPVPRARAWQQLG